MKLEIGIVIYRIFESSISIVPYDIAYGIVFILTASSSLRHRPYGIVLTASADGTVTSGIAIDGIMTDGIVTDGIATDDIRYSG